MFCQGEIYKLSSFGKITAKSRIARRSRKKGRIGARPDRGRPGRTSVRYRTFVRLHTQKLAVSNLRFSTVEYTSLHKMLYRDFVTINA